MARLSKAIISMPILGMVFSFASCNSSSGGSETGKVIVTKAINSNNATLVLSDDSRQTPIYLYLDNDKMREDGSYELAFDDHTVEYSNYREIIDGIEYYYSKRNDYDSEWNLIASRNCAFEKYSLVNLGADYVLPTVLNFTDLDKLKMRDKNYYFDEFNYFEMYKTYFERYPDFEAELRNEIESCNEETYIEFIVDDSNTLTKITCKILNLSVGYSSTEGYSVHSQIGVIECTFSNYGSTVVDRPIGIEQ